jgi:hypothetical protein
MSSLTAAAQLLRMNAAGAKSAQMPGKSSSGGIGGVGESNERRSSADDSGAVAAGSGAAVAETSLPRLAVKLSSLMKSGGSEVLLGESFFCFSCSCSCCLGLCGW